MDAVRRLRKLNFDNLLCLASRNGADYGFKEYRKNGYKHPEITGYCIECESKGYSTAPK